MLTRRLLCYGNITSPAATPGWFHLSPEAFERPRAWTNRARRIHQT